ncbi:hypothetical protein NDA11_003036 [Ustilago hordei]|nr:hypothetical protein NDA11_003036 [Ustilago hordei]
MVYINRRNWKTRRPTPKLDTRFAGPYPVQERPTMPPLPDEDLDFKSKHSSTSVHTMGLQSTRCCGEGTQKKLLHGNQ